MLWLRVITFIKEFYDGDDRDDDESTTTIIVYINRVHLNIKKLQE